MSKQHYSQIARDLGAFVEQTIMPSAAAETTTAVVRPPSYMGASKTCAAHTGITVKGKYGDVTTDGAWTATTTEGEAMVMIFPSMGNAMSATYGDQLFFLSSSATLKLSGRFRSTLKTLRIGGGNVEYRSARPTRVATNPDIIVHAVPDSSGRWVNPITTAVGAGGITVSADFSIVRSNDPVFTERLDINFYYRNVLTGTWASVTSTNVCNSYVNSTATFVIPLTTNIDLWYFTVVGPSGCDFTFDYALEFTSTTGSTIQVALPPVANVQQILPNPLLGSTDAGWDVQAAAFVSGSIDLNCTASDLQNGGNIVSARLGQNEYPTQYLEQALLSSVVDSYSGHFKSGSYGWLLPDFHSYTERDANHVEFDQGVVMILRADTRGGYQVIGQLVYQGMSKSPLYEYRPPANIPNFPLLVEQLRLMPPVMDNEDHLKYLKKLVSSAVDVVGSQSFATALKAGEAVLNVLPNGVVKMAGKTIVGAGKGAHKAAAKKNSRKKSSKQEIDYNSMDPKHAPPPPPKAKRQRKPKSSRSSRG